MSPKEAMCEVIGIKFSPSLDDFSGRGASDEFLNRLDAVYHEMKVNPPTTAKKVLQALSYLSLDKGISYDIQ